jgi:hypothetical protein
LLSYCFDCCLYNNAADKEAEMLPAQIKAMSLKLQRCQRCGGQLIHSYGDIECLQCGAGYATDSRLEKINSVVRLIIEESKVDRSAVYEGK